MAYPTPSFAALTGTQPLSLFDAMFAQVAAMVAIPCTASGSATAIVLTPTGNAPSLAAYATGNFFNFKAVGNSTSAVTIQFMALAALPLYFADGTTQVTTQIVSGRNYIVVFDAALNSGNGGYYLPMPQMPGTAGQVLTMAASGPAYATPVNSAMVLLNTMTASNVAALSDITSFTATYDNYLIVFTNVVPITNATTFFAEVTSNGGGLWAGSGYLSTIWGATGAAASNFNTAGGGQEVSTANILLSGNTAVFNQVANTAGAGVSGQMYVHNVNTAAASKNFVGQVNTFDAVSGKYDSLCIGSAYTAVSAINGIRFKFSSGNVSTGVIKVYGIA